MLSKLGIVTNIWAARLEAGDRFEDLLAQFSKNGFRYMEIRDGDYLRKSEFGQFLHGLESAMARYSDEQWRQICEGVEAIIKQEDQSTFKRFRSFSQLASDVEISYAMAHPWLDRYEETNADDAIIIQAKKLAYLLCPRAARLRLVDPEFSGEVDVSTAVSNLKRYSALLDRYPIVFAIENAKPPATITSDLSVQGGVMLAYDEANTYGTDGVPVNPPEAFWDAVKMDSLTSVHIKQKTADGVTSQIHDGYVDFKAIFARLKAGGYDNDLLLENAPTDQPLEDAIRSREYLSNLKIKK